MSNMCANLIGRVRSSLLSKTTHHKYGGDMFIPLGKRRREVNHPLYENNMVGYGVKTWCVVTSMILIKQLRYIK